MRPFHTLLLAALAMVALAGAARAQAEDGVCTPSDLEGFRHLFTRADGSFQSAGDLAAAREGDRLITESSANLDCEGDLLILRSFTHDAGRLRLFQEDTQEGFRVRPGADFVFFELTLGIPPCEFRVELHLRTSAGDTLLQHVDGGTTACPDVPPPACPEVLVTSSDTAGNTIIWREDARASRVNVYRGVGDELQRLATIPRGVEQFLDEDVEPGVTYTYLVTGANASGESTGCETVRITTVPLFGGPLVGALALAGLVGAYGAMRRRGA